MKKDLLEKAALMVFEYHGEQLRKFSNELYVNHCLRVAALVGDYTDDDELVAAALLHDIIEDTLLTFRELEKQFGSKITSLVRELTTEPSELVKVGKRIYIANKFNIFSNEALIIKILDRLDNLTDLINSNATLPFVKTYVSDTDYIIDNIDRELLPVHKELFYNLSFINNYVALTILR